MEKKKTPKTLTSDYTYHPPGHATHKDPSAASKTAHTVRSNQHKSTRYTLFSLFVYSTCERSDNNDDGEFGDCDEKVRRAYNVKFCVFVFFGSLLAFAGVKRALQFTCRVGRLVTIVVQLQRNAKNTCSWYQMKEHVVLFQPTTMVTWNQETGWWSLPFFVCNSGYVLWPLLP